MQKFWVEQPGLDAAVKKDPTFEAELAQVAATNDSLYPIEFYVEHRSVYFC